MSTDTTPTEQHRPTTDPDQQIVHDDVAVEIRTDHEAEQAIVLADHITSGVSLVGYVDGHATPAEVNDALEELAQAATKEARSNGGAR
jgi:hypothetical protein